MHGFGKNRALFIILFDIKVGARDITREHHFINAPDVKAWHIFDERSHDGCPVHHHQNPKRNRDPTPFAIRVKPANGAYFIWEALAFNATPPPEKRIEHNHRPIKAKHKAGY